MNPNAEPIDPCFTWGLGQVSLIDEIGPFDEDAVNARFIRLQAASVYHAYGVETEATKKLCTDELARKLFTLFKNATVMSEPGFLSHPQERLWQFRKKAVLGLLKLRTQMLYPELATRHGFRVYADDCGEPVVCFRRLVGQ